MRILVVCPHFEPDVAPTGVVISEIAHRLIDEGHELDVVTSLPWYTSHAIEPGWGGRLMRRERTDWGSITRVHPFPTDKRNIPARAAAFAGFTVLATIFAVLRRRRPDVVLVMSPPLTLGLTGWLAARLRRVPFVFNIQDVFPDVAVEVGAISNPRVIRVLRWLERFTYRRADAVTVLSDDLRANVEEKLDGKGGTIVRVIPNFVDTQRIVPGSRENHYRSEFGLGDRTVVMYAGNLGFSQPLELMVEAARALRTREDLVFVINGGGSTRPGLEEAAADLDNLRFVDLQPVDRLPEVLAAGDIHVVALRAGLGRSSVPSKLYSILAAGRPVLASVDAGTEVVRVVESVDAGIAVGPDDPEAFIAGVEAMASADRAAMGQRGRAFVEEWVSPAAVAAAYAELFRELRGG
ncbi:MAG: glycosyltransferase family 4 protein [Acidimicrobiales bacterium]